MHCHDPPECQMFKILTYDALLVTPLAPLSISLMCVLRDLLESEL